jgi:excisionase family DNA binding protein
MEAVTSAGAAHEPVDDSAEKYRAVRVGRRRVIRHTQLAMRSAKHVSTATKIDDSRLDVTTVVLLTVAETASLLRTTRKGIYAMVERHQISGVIRIGRRVLFRRDDLLHWLDQKRAPSP